MVTIREFSFALVASLTLLLVAWYGTGAWLAANHTGAPLSATFAQLPQRFTGIESAIDLIGSRVDITISMPREQFDQWQGGMPLCLTKDGEQ